MNLSSPITIQPPIVHDIVHPSFVIDSLDIMLLDNSKYKTVSAILLPSTRPLLLWCGETYDTIGDYTQAQAEARILELLGDDPKSMIESLYLVPRI